MFKVCKVCGKRVLSLFKHVTSCPRCNSEFSIINESSTVVKTQGLRFPQRRQTSEQDDFDMKAKEIWGNTGSFTLYNTTVR